MSIVFLNPRTRSTGQAYLHVAADDDVVGGVADNLVLELLPALERLLDQDLGRERERLGRQVTQLLLVLGKAGTEATEREGGTENDGVADLLGSLEGVLDGRDGGRSGGGDTDLVEGLDEQVAVLRDFESADLSTEDLYAETLKDTHLLELDTDVEGRLATEREEDAVRTLLLEDVGYVFGGDGKDCVVRGSVRRCLRYLAFGKGSQ